MDKGNGVFERLSDIAAKKFIGTSVRTKIFSVGEEVEIKESRFKIIGIGKREMRLKLLPKYDHELIGQ